MTLDERLDEMEAAAREAISTRRLTMFCDPETMIDLIDRFREEYAAIDRIWDALGITGYVGKEISEIVADLVARLRAAEAVVEASRYLSGHIGTSYPRLSEVIAAYEALGASK